MSAVRAAPAALVAAALVLVCCGDPAAASCSGGNKATIQLVSSNCTADTLGSASEIPVCGATYKVDTAKGILTFTPISTRVYTYWDYPGRNVTRDCQTATARAKVTGAGSATVQLYRDDVKESKLAVTSGGQLDLLSYRFYSGRSTIEVCKFTYKVVEGCLLGISASGAFTCPPATGAKTGLGGAKYCEPCVFNTYSPGGAASCTPCPPDSQRPSLPASVRSQCPSCLATRTCYNGCDDGNSYIDPATKKCTKCPAGSFLTPRQDACAICIEGRRCCLTNPTPDCPACPKGAIGKPLSFSLAAVGVSGAGREKCPLSDVYQCQQSIRITVGTDCSINLAVPPAYTRPSYIRDFSASPVPRPPAHPASPDPFPCDTYLPNGQIPVTLNVNNSGTFNFATDVLPRVLTRWSNDLPGTVAAISGAYFTATYANTTCQVRYRVHSASSPAALAPLELPGSCLAGAPECAKTCPAGSYVTGGLCLPCPAGSYSTKPDSSACKPCKKGTAAFGSGNTKCRACPEGTASQGTGASFCASCTGNYYNRYSVSGNSDCAECPSDSASVGTGCLSLNTIAPCCRTGKCPGVPKCPSRKAPGRVESNAILRPLSQSATCAATPFIACAAGGSIYLANAYDKFSPISMQMSVLGGNRAGPYCTKSDYRQTTATRTGMNTFTFPVTIGNPPTNYEAWQGNAKVDPSGLITFTIAKNVPSYELRDATLPAPCVATFQLISGVLLGAKKAVTQCSKGLRLVSAGPTKLCRSCGSGNALTGGKCVKCSGNTYTPDFDATSCATCPPGNVPGYPSDNQGGFLCYPCDIGTRRTPAGKCEPCPVNSFAAAASDTCAKCPAGTSTKSRKGAGFCFF